MRTKRTALALAAMAAVGAGMTATALAATRPPAPAPRSTAAFTPGSGQLAVDWNRELITILGTPGAQPATVHPTRSFAILQSAEYDAVTSITHASAPYLFSVPASRDARRMSPGHLPLRALPVLPAGHQIVPSRRAAARPPVT